MVRCWNDLGAAYVEPPPALLYCAGSELAVGLVGSGENVSPLLLAVWGAAQLQWKIQYVNRNFYLKSQVFVFSF